MFSFEFCKTFKNSVLTEQLRAVASKRSYFYVSQRRKKKDFYYLHKKEKENLSVWPIYLGVVNRIKVFFCYQSVTHRIKHDLPYLSDLKNQNLRILFLFYSVNPIWSPEQLFAIRGKQKEVFLKLRCGWGCNKSIQEAIWWWYFKK